MGVACVNNDLDQPESEIQQAHFKVLWEIQVANINTRVFLCQDICMEQGYRRS